MWIPRDSKREQQGPYSRDPYIVSLRMERRELQQEAQVDAEPVLYSKERMGHISIRSIRDVLWMVWDAPSDSYG